MKLALVCSRVRVEEKLILTALRERGIPHDRLDTGNLVLNPR